MDTLFNPIVQRSIDRGGMQDVVQFTEDASNYVLRNGTALKDIIKIGYTPFRNPQREGTEPSLIEPIFPNITLVYDRIDTVGTLNLAFLDPDTGKTPVDTFYVPNQPDMSIIDLVSATNSNPAPFATIGKLTIGRFKRGDFVVGKDIQAFMHLSNAAAKYVRDHFECDANGVMIARESLMRKLKSLQLEFSPVPGVSLKDNDPEVSDYFDYYSRYWCKGPRPNLYATKASTIIKATEPFVNGDLIDRTAGMASMLLRVFANSIIG